jgi:hypothetical protein
VINTELIVKKLKHSVLVVIRNFLEPKTNSFIVAATRVTYPGLLTLSKILRL